jgi:transposase
MLAYEQSQYGGEFKVGNNSLNAPKFPVQSVFITRNLEKGSIGFSLFTYKFNRKWAFMKQVRMQTYADRQTDTVQLHKNKTKKKV